MGTLELRVVPEPEARCAALLTGEVDAYDLVGLDGFAPLAREGIQVLYRDPYAVSYLGLNQRVRAFPGPGRARAVRHRHRPRVTGQVPVPTGPTLGGPVSCQHVSTSTGTTCSPRLRPPARQGPAQESSSVANGCVSSTPATRPGCCLQEPERVCAQISAQLTARGLPPAAGAHQTRTGYLDAVSTRDGDHASASSGGAAARDPDSFVGPAAQRAAGAPGVRRRRADTTAVNRAAGMPRAIPAPARTERRRPRVRGDAGRAAVPPVSAVAVSSGWSTTR
ncbi:hypothetical protein QJS66_00590 [Kocuria rhizophila]|nr:hypothetical protein QJS66_00590 [Kocuria rhizophila]